MRTWPGAVVTVAMTMLIGCRPPVDVGDESTTEPPPGTTTDADDTETPVPTVSGDTIPDTDTAADGSTGARPEIDLGPCGNIDPCLLEQGLVNQELIDRYGPTGTCWQDFPAPTCWVQCEAWLETVVDNCTVESPSCCTCTSAAECDFDPTRAACEAGRCVGGALTCDTVSFATDIQPILDANCIECHAPGGVWPSLDMTVDAYADLVDADGIQTMALADVRLVVPGDPELSYILYKLEGTQAEIAGAAAGSQMPQGMEPLDPALRETIRLWIECGAPL